mgnify:FL=1|tara:strand:- start:67 stop:486 length:420 start_codon:yes stop_codon:yes gene_type:complete
MNNNISKSSLVCTFVEQKSLEKTYSNLEKGFGVDTNKVFIFNIEDKEKYLITYKVNLDNEQRKDFKRRMRHTFPIHKKGKTFFTINGLNKLIEKIYKLISGNINYKDYQINWKDYDDKLIMIREKELYIIDLDRVFLDK